MSKHYSICTGGNSGLEILTSMHATIEEMIEEVNSSDIGDLLVVAWNDHARALNRLPQTTSKIPLKDLGTEIDFADFVKTFPSEAGWGYTHSYYEGNAYHFEFFNITAHDLDGEKWRNV